jgi:hypothetical protein
MLDFVARAVDTVFLSSEVDNLVIAHERLKAEIKNRQFEIESLDLEIQSKRDDLTRAINQRNYSLAEIEQLLGVRGLTVENLTIIASQRETIDELLIEIHSLETSKEKLNTEINNLSQAHREKLTEVDQQLASYRKTCIGEINTELENLKREVIKSVEEYRQQTINDHEINLKAELETLSKENNANLETLENERIERIEEITKEMAVWENRLAQHRETYDRERNQLITQAREVIEIEKQKFFLERDRELNRIEQHKLSVEHRLTHETKQVIDEHKGIVIGPYQAEIESLKDELVKLYSQLATKTEKSVDWSVKQIEVWLTKQRKGKTEPQHIRVCGESESGKSHLVNQLISQGLQYFGVDADYLLIDPFQSQTDWAIKPTISNNLEMTISEIESWANKADDDSPPLDKPMILIVDEIDRVIIKEKSVVNHLRSIWSGGRHKGIFLWVIGQNANVKKLTPLDWSDLDNVSQIYLNASGLQFVKNGLSGQNTRPLEGQLAAIKARSQYYATVKTKGVDPYGTSIPLSLFTGPGPTTTTINTPTPSTVVCGNCESPNVVRNGKLNNRPRYKCKDCGKQGYGKG